MAQANGKRVFGFTGTSKGMKLPQLVAVVKLVEDLGVTVMHLGDCIGADTEAYHICRQRGIYCIGHPPSNPKARAFLAYNEERPPKPYLVRNMDIAMEGYSGLIAAPPNFIETPHQGEGAGTWSTVRRARRAKRKIWIVYPTGSYDVEGP